MRNKILIELNIPAVEKKYDIFVPVDSRLGDVLNLMNAVINELSEGKFIAARDSILCDAVTGDIFNINMLVGEIGLINGSQLMLI